MRQVFKPYRNKPVNFLNLLLEQRQVAPPYTKITNTLSKRIVYDAQKPGDVQGLKRNYSFVDIPSYLQPEINLPSKAFRLHKIPTYKGTLIQLLNYKTTEEYLKANFSPGRRSKFKMYKKRLDICFNTQYKVYYGDISEAEYNMLFDTLLNMLKSRFAQKQAINDDLERWHEYLAIAYGLICKKEACLFVIYDGPKPISIGLNLHYDKAAYGYIRGYDVDYAKFYLGFTDVLVQLDWYFKQGFEVFDLLKGEYEYKANLTDGAYSFERHIIYDAGSLTASLFGMLQVLKTRVFYWGYHLLKKWNIHLCYHRFKSRKGTDVALAPIPQTSEMSLAEFENITLSDTAQWHHNIALDSSDFLRRPVYDFLYATQESINTVKISRIEQERNSFYIKGLTKVQKITFITHNEGIVQNSNGRTANSLEDIV